MIFGDTQEVTAQQKTYISQGPTCSKVLFAWVYFLSYLTTYGVYIF